MAMVRDSSFGLPMDKIYDLEGLSQSRGENWRSLCPCNSSGLSGHGGELLFCLIRLMWLHTLSSHRIDNFVIAVNPRKRTCTVQFFIFMIFPATLRWINTPFVQGAPAVGQWMNVKNSYETFEKAYAAKPQVRIFLIFFFVTRRVFETTTRFPLFYSL
jgi:hypothetical protein